LEGLIYEYGYVTIFVRILRESIGLPLPGATCGGREPIACKGRFA
jgi:hypothetical protein